MDLLGTSECQYGHIYFNQTSRLRKVFSTLFAGQAMAADVHAHNDAYEVVIESGQRANEVFSANYSQDSVAGKSRDEVRQELAEAIESGLFDNHISA
ncbi:MAG: DUF4148 domain-containing protein [Alcaligenaceae bacterium]|nr:DUF4148 domain-containing protein [Alcaligenaceae bacterium]